jgi:hypothetical protein
VAVLSAPVPDFTQDADAIVHHGEAWSNLNFDSADVTGPPEAAPVFLRTAVSISVQILKHAPVPQVAQHKQCFEEDVSVHQFPNC